MFNGFSKSAPFGSVRMPRWVVRGQAGAFNRVCSCETRREARAMAAAWRAEPTPVVAVTVRDRRKGAY